MLDKNSWAGLVLLSPLLPPFFFFLSISYVPHDEIFGREGEKKRLCPTLRAPDLTENRRASESSLSTIAHLCKKVVFQGEGCIRNLLVLP